MFGLGSICSSDFDKFAVITLVCVNLLLATVTREPNPKRAEQLKRGIDLMDLRINFSNAT